MKYIATVVVIACMCVACLVYIKKELNRDNGYRPGHSIPAIAPLHEMAEPRAEAAKKWELDYVKAKTLQYEHALCIKKHNGDDVPSCMALDKEYDVLFDRLNNNYPYQEMGYALRMRDLGLCGYECADSIYYYGMKMGKNPSQEVENCFRYGHQ